MAAISAALTFAQLNGPSTTAPAGPSRPFDPDDAMLLVTPAIWLGGAS